MTNYIWVTTEFFGVHKYPKAPEQVRYLRNEHRHKFFVKLYLEVFHNDREVEFHMLQNELGSCCDNFPFDMKSNSCEDIADMISHYIVTRYPNRKIKISVSEDNENGVEKSYSKS